MTTAQSTTTQRISSNPDAELLKMIRRHRDLYREMDRLYELGGDDATDGPAYQAASDEAIDLETTIAVWWPKTAKGEAARLRFLGMHPDIVDGFDVGNLLATIAELNAERVAAGRTTATRAHATAAAIA